MRLMINGDAQEITIDSDILMLQQLLLTLGYLQHVDKPQNDGLKQPRNFVVALNQQIVAPPAYAETAVGADDRIDILAAITGG